MKLKWRNKIEFLVDEDEIFETTTIQWKKGFTPRGRRRIIGYMEVSFENKTPVIETVFVAPYARGLGLGYHLYEFVLKKHGSLQTSYHYASKSARRVWNKLKKKYLHETDFFEPKLTIFLD